MASVVFNDLSPFVQASLRRWAEDIAHGKAQDRPEKLSPQTSLALRRQANDVLTALRAPTLPDEFEYPPSHPSVYSPSTIGGERVFAPIGFLLPITNEPSHFRNSVVRALTMAHYEFKVGQNIPFRAHELAWLRDLAIFYIRVDGSAERPLNILISVSENPRYPDLLRTQAIDAFMATFDPSHYGQELLARSPITDEQLFGRLDDAYHAERWDSVEFYTTLILARLKEKMMEGDDAKVRDQILKHYSEKLLQHPSFQVRIKGFVEFHSKTDAQHWWQSSERERYTAELSRFESMKNPPTLFRFYFGAYQEFLQQTLQVIP